MNLSLFIPIFIIGLVLAIVIFFIKRTDQEDQKQDIYHKIEPFARNSKILVQPH